MKIFLRIQTIIHWWLIWQWGRHHWKVTLSSETGHWPAYSVWLIQLLYAPLCFQWRNDVLFKIFRFLQNQRLLPKMLCKFYEIWWQKNVCRKFLFRCIEVGDKIPLRKKNAINFGQYSYFFSLIHSNEEKKIIRIYNVKREISKFSEV